MLKFGLKFLQDRKSKEGKNPHPKGKPELPAFEWQVTSEGGQTLGDSITEATATVTPPDDALLGKPGKRKPSPLRNIGSRLKRSSTHCEPGRIRLTHILECETTREKFRNYLVSQYCEENLDFYVDVARYRSLFDASAGGFSNNQEEVTSLAVYVWDVYLDEDTSSKPLNVPQDLSNKVRRLVEAKKYPSDLFDKLQQHCFDLMVQDSLPKFTRNSLITPVDNNPIHIVTPASPCEPPSPTFRPPLFMGINKYAPRKSNSSGSLHTNFKTSSETSLNSTSPSIGKSPSATNAPERTKLQNAASLSSLSAATNQRMSMVGASISNIKRRMLSRRRDSTCSISSLASITTSESEPSTASPGDKVSLMPGSYPSNPNDSDGPKAYPVGFRDYASTNGLTSLKLRHNVSNPNLNSSEKMASMVWLENQSQKANYSPAVFFTASMFNKALPPTPEHVTT